MGERIAFYRRRRGLSQVVLADLVGRSEDWLSKIERGEREIRRLDVLAEVARALRVTLGDLLGEPVLMEDAEEHDDVPAIRDALMAPRRLSRTLFSSSLSPEYIDPAPVTSLTEGAWSAYQRGDLGRVITALPGLIKTTEQMEAASADDAVYRRTCAAVSARIHHLAATTLSKIGEADLAWIAAERAMQAADEADDPLVLASAARSGTHALLAVGRFDDALELGEVAARWLGPRMTAGDPAALSLYGMLHLRTAVAAARHQDRGTAGDLLGLAGRAADQLGEDANYWFTGFGPSNVELHKLSAALDLGDISQVIESGPRINVDHLPVERQVTHLIDLARAYSLVAKDDEALQTLLTAEQKSPTIVRHSTLVREVVRSMYRRASPPRCWRWPSAAERCGSGMASRVLGLVVSGAGGVEDLVPGLIVPAIEAAWTVAVTATPTAARWMAESGQLTEVERVTGYPVRSEPRFPHEVSPHPQVSCYLVAPASANTVAKLALGIADNQALTQVNEAIGTRDLPVVVFPRVNAAHARHPAWNSHLDALRRAGVHLIYGPDVWPLYEPREAGPRQLPWSAVLSAAEKAVTGSD